MNLEISVEGSRVFNLGLSSWSQQLWALQRGMVNPETDVESVLFAQGRKNPWKCKILAPSSTLPSFKLLLEVITQSCSNCSGDFGKVTASTSLATARQYVAAGVGVNSLALLLLMAITAFGKSPSHWWLINELSITPKSCRSVVKLQQLASLPFAPNIAAYFPTSSPNSLLIELLLFWH